MRRSSRLKGGGYLVSTGSVLFLGIPAIESARDDAWMMVCVVLGIALSIVGMGLRWLSHRKGVHETDV